MPVLSRIPSRASGYRFSLLFIFNAGPMLIAVFITEMVILHKYVYLLLFIIIIKMVGIFSGSEELVTINS